MSPVLPLVGVLFFVFLLARGLGELAERLGAPALVGEIAAGIVIANLVVGNFHLLAALELDPSTGAGALNREVLEALVEIGVVFLVFAVGLELPASDLVRSFRISSRTAAFGVVVPFALGALFLVALEGPANVLPALFGGTALMVTSLTVTARFLRERDLLGTVEARVILGAAVIEDVVGVVLLTVLLGIAAGRIHGPVDLLVQVGVVLAFAGIFAVAVLRYGPRLVRRYVDPADRTDGVSRFRTRNAVLVGALLLCLGASALAQSFQLASILGAFFVGMALAEYRDRLELRSAFEALNTFFVPFFFVGIGLLVSVGDLAATWPLAIALTVLAVVGKLAAYAFESKALPRRTALRVSVGMVPRGEVGIIAALAAFSAGFINGDLYTALVLTSAATAIIGPLWLARLFARAEPPASPPAEASGTAP
ncbi:MAG TPA: cation:proton antiporter [Thermoplasmata archaeon]|nr:cation:proton antiporter [Thermoplasmata archaeon]